MIRPNTKCYFWTVLWGSWGESDCFIPATISVPGTKLAPSLRWNWGFESTNQNHFIRENTGKNPLPISFPLKIRRFFNCEYMFFKNLMKIISPEIVLLHFYFSFSSLSGLATILFLPKATALCFGISPFSKFKSRFFGRFYVLIRPPVF